MMCHHPVFQQRVSLTADITPDTGNASDKLASPTTTGPKCDMSPNTNDDTHEMLVANPTTGAAPDDTGTQGSSNTEQ